MKNVLTGIMLAFSLALLALVGLALIGVLGPAFAQDVAATVPAPAPTTTVSVGWFASFIASYLEPLLGAVITGILGWLASILKSKWSLDIEASHRDALQTALTNAAALLIQKGISATSSKVVDVGNPLVKAAIDYVQANAKDAMAYFGLSPEQVAEKIAAKLPQIPAATPVV